MAMIGRDAAVAEIGGKRHELHGPIAFSAWLGVHALLMCGVRARVDAFIDWAWDYFTKTRAHRCSIEPTQQRIDWDEHAVDARTRSEESA